MGRDDPNHAYRYDEWPVDGGETRYLGVAGEGVAMLYNPTTDELTRGEIDERNERIVPGETERELDPGESLGDALASIGESVDWESLSEFAEEHLDADPDRTDRDR
ncbi:hypothetical protein [Natronorarus salvus]|uniref:hypothetical protein n=1 Tax=Natronorarus salvus TaxID=3117733 RepID=UPI002F26B5D6